MVKRLSFTAIIVAYILIVFGGYVASSESGMGCGPEWPLCNGDVIPNMQGETLIEFTHRAIGLFLFILSSALFMYIIKTSNDNKLRKVNLWMMGLLTLQVLAGAVVVLLDLPAIVITLHLIVAMIFIYTLLWIYRSGNEMRQKSAISYSKQKRVKTHLSILLGLVLLTLAFGAYIKHQSYGLACSWLDCRDTVLPTSGPEILQTIHRFLAAVTAIYTLLLAILAYVKHWRSTVQSRMILASFLVLLQIGSGILAVLTHISVPFAVLHLAIATAFFIVISDTRIVMSQLSRMLYKK